MDTFLGKYLEENTKMRPLVLIILAVMPVLASAQRGRGRPALKKSDMLVPVIEGEIGQTYPNYTSDGSELHYVFRIENMGK